MHKIQLAWRSWFWVCVAKICISLSSSVERRPRKRLIWAPENICMRKDQGNWPCLGEDLWCRRSGEDWAHPDPSLEGRFFGSLQGVKQEPTGTLWLSDRWFKTQGLAGVAASLSCDWWGAVVTCSGQSWRQCWEVYKQASEALSLPSSALQMLSPLSVSDLLVFFIESFLLVTERALCFAKPNCLGTFIPCPSFSVFLSQTCCAMSLKGLEHPFCLGAYKQLLATAWGDTSGVWGQKLRTASTSSNCYKAAASQEWVP